METDTSERRNIFLRLRSRKWFKNTDSGLKNELQNLPEDFDGYLSDLADRPEMIGNVEVLKLVKLSHGNYQVISMFEVRSVLNNERFTYEYMSWKFGKHPGHRGIILIEVDGEIKFFLIKKGQKFPIAEEIYDAIGTFSPTKFSRKGVDKINLPSNIEDQIKKLLGISDINFKRFIDLGLINPDAGLTNNHTAIFAGIIDVAHENKIRESLEGKKLATLAPGFEIEIHPIEKISEFVEKSNDSYFLSCVARLSALKIIKI